MEELVKKYVDAVLTFREVINELSKEWNEEDIVPFLRAVVEEMRKRGVSEDIIGNSLKGAFGGKSNWDAISEQIKASPNIFRMVGIEESPK